MIPHWNWKPITTAPKTGKEILIVLPGAHSDHFYVVHWKDNAWRSRFSGNSICITENDIRKCYTRPSWVELDDPPGSLCRDDYEETVEDKEWHTRARTLWE